MDDLERERLIPVAAQTLADFANEGTDSGWLADSFTEEAAAVVDAILSYQRGRGNFDPRDIKLPSGGAPLHA